MYKHLTHIYVHVPHTYMYIYHTHTTKQAYTVAYVCVRIETLIYVSDVGHKYEYVYMHAGPVRLVSSVQGSL